MSARSWFEITCVDHLYIDVAFCLSNSLRMCKVCTYVCHGCYIKEKHHWHDSLAYLFDIQRIHFVFVATVVIRWMVEFLFYRVGKHAMVDQQGNSVDYKLLSMVNCLIWIQIYVTDCTLKGKLALVPTIPYVQNIILLRHNIINIVILEQ